MMLQTTKTTGQTHSKAQHNVTRYRVQCNTTHLDTQHNDAKNGTSQSETEERITVQHRQNTGSNRQINIDQTTVHRKTQDKA